jgi:hypothetical protein
VIYVGCATMDLARLICRQFTQALVGKTL